MSSAFRILDLDVKRHSVRPRSPPIGSVLMLPAGCSSSMGVFGPEGVGVGTPWEASESESRVGRRCMPRTSSLPMRLTTRTLARLSVLLILRNVGEREMDAMRRGEGAFPSASYGRCGVEWWCGRLECVCVVRGFGGCEGSWLCWPGGPSWPWPARPWEGAEPNWPGGDPEYANLEREFGREGNRSRSSWPAWAAISSSPLE